MKKTAFLCAFVLAISWLPAPTSKKVMAAPGNWTQANGSSIPNYDEFNRSDDTNGTVCATSNSGKPYLCWSEYKSGGYKICISTSDGQNWTHPSTNATYPYPDFEVLNVSGSCSNPSMIVINYDDGTTNQDIPIIFYDRYDGTHYKSSCAYLKNDVWHFNDFTHYTNQEVKPFVTLGDDDRLYATWCQGTPGYSSLPVVIVADLEFPLVWKQLDGTPVTYMANTIFSRTEFFYHSRVSTFNGLPFICAEYKENINAGMDIVILKWGGANWSGLNSANFTIIGDPTNSDYLPRMVVTNSGLPVLCWETDFGTIKKTYFSFWNNANWVIPGGTPGFLDISQSFLAGSPSFNADMIMGQYNICHLAVNTTNNDILYLQTDLSRWFTVESNTGSTRLSYGISKPSLASWKSNYPMIAGDRLLPSDNPAFTMYWVDQSFFVEWGIEISQPPFVKLLYDDDGKMIPAVNGREYKIRAIINIPRGYQAANIFAIYTVPANGRFIPNISFETNRFLGKWVWKQGARDWLQVPIFPLANSPFWKDVTKLKFQLNPQSLIQAIRFDISFNGFGQTKKWMKNLLEVSLDAEKNLTPITPTLLATPQATTIEHFTSTSIVSNPIGQYITPTFYLNVDPGAGTISSDGTLVAYFTVYIIPIGPFIEDVYLSMPEANKYGLIYSFKDRPVPGRPGIRTTTLTVTGSSQTPPGIITTKIQGDVLATPVITAQSNSLFSAAATEPPPTVNITLNVERAKLVLTKKADRVNVQPNSVITYTITIRNVGGATATDVLLKDVLPEDVDYLSSFPSGGASGKTITWDVGDIPKNKSVIYTIKVRVKDLIFSVGSMISNVASAEYDGWLTSSATVFVTVRPTETPCPTPQAEIRFETDGKDPQAGVEINGELRVWDGCNPYKFQLFWGDDTQEVFGYLDEEGYYSLPPHAYATSGTYFLVCYVTDKYGKQNVIRKQMVVH